MAFNIKDGFKINETGTEITDIRESIREDGNESHNALVTEKAIVDAFSIGFNGVYSTPSGIVSGDNIKDWIGLHFSSIAPTISISANPTFTLYKEGYTITNPTITGRANEGSNPVGTFESMEFRRGSTLIATESSPATSTNIEQVDTFNVTATQTYTVKITDSEGRSDTASNSFVFTLPYFATTSTITTMTEQPLKVKTSNYFQVNMVAENDSGDKQRYDHSDIFNAVTGVQFYNTISNAWEWLSGSKSNSLSNFDTTSVNHTVLGNTRAYTRYTNNSAKIGARQLRFYTN